MTTLRLDLVGGAAGDMLLAALVDCGAEPARIEAAVNDLNFGAVRFETERVRSGGVSGLRLTIVQEGDRADHGHEHRAWCDIRAGLERSSLPAGARELALSVFERLAAAEAAVHGVRPDSVQFHEVGALDSIADIVGACLALDLLGVEEVSAGPFPIGRGEVRCAHGVYPLPAPATAELLKGAAFVEVDETEETVTPTGAALVLEWMRRRPVREGGTRRTIRSIGYGIGARTLRSRPNFVRAMIETPASAGDVPPTDCLVLETQMDDAPGEWIGVLVERLMEGGALDVFTCPVQMKKQRPGVLVTAICEPSRRDALLDLFFRHGTTLGVREYPVRRTVLERGWITVATPHGDVRVKLGVWRGEVVTRAPEMDDCIARAAAVGVPARVVYEAAWRAAGGA